MKKSSAFSLIELSIVILIIGILIAGITQSSRLISAMRLASARQTTQSSPVSSIRGLTMWLESTSENSFATGTASFTNVSDLDDTALIGRWNDINPQAIEGDKNNASQTTGGNQPAYALNAINSLPAVKFDGNDGLRTNKLTNDSYAFFAVIKTSTAGATGEAFLGGKLVDSDVPGITNDSTALSIGGGFVKTATGNPDSTLAGTTTVSDNVPHIIYASRNHITGERKIYVDGKLDASDTAKTGSLPGGSNTYIGIGDNIDGGYYNGNVGEIIGYGKVLKDEERKSIEKYLAKKWGIKI